MSYPFVPPLSDLSAMHSKEKLSLPSLRELHAYNSPESATFCPPVSPIGKPAPTKGNGTPSSSDLFGPAPANVSPESASMCPLVPRFGRATKCDGSSSSSYLSGPPPGNSCSISAYHEADKNSKSQEGYKTVRPNGQKSPELLPYHQEAHGEATKYLRALYFEIEKNPTVALYNPNKYNGPSSAVKEAIDKIDEINGRLLTINCFSNLSIAVGQIMRDDFVQRWRSFIYASKERREKHLSELENMCEELHYPSGWANIPPGGPEEPHANPVMDEHKHW